MGEGWDVQGVGGFRAPVGAGDLKRRGQDRTGQFTNAVLGFKSNCSTSL